MKSGNRWNEFRESLDNVTECADRTVRSLRETVEKLDVLMRTIKKNRCGAAAGDGL